MSGCQDTAASNENCVWVCPPPTVLDTEVVPEPPTVLDTLVVPPPPPPARCSPPLTATVGNSCARASLSSATAWAYSASYCFTF